MLEIGLQEGTPMKYYLNIVNDDKETFAIRDNGDFIVNEKVIDNDKEVVEHFKSIILKMKPLEKEEVDFNELKDFIILNLRVYLSSLDAATEDEIIVVCEPIATKITHSLLSAFEIKRL